MSTTTTTLPTRVNHYEGMFLISQGVAADLNAAVAHIRSNIEKFGGTILAMRKWDERRLAFEIEKQKRGIYILCYFSAPAPAMGQIERAFNLSEQVMRQLIIKAEHMTLEQMKAADGTKELEIEAKLRATQPSAIPVTPVATIADDESEEI